MPFPYAQVVKFVICLYIGLTPFAIVDTLGWLTPAGTFMLSMLFLAVDEIGAEIEDPFGRKDFDKALNARQAAHKLVIIPHAAHEETHFVNLEAVIREIDVTTSMIVAQRNGTTRQLMLNEVDGPHCSVCAHS